MRRSSSGRQESRGRLSALGYTNCKAFPATSPARGNLFTVDTMSPKLEEERKALFHHCVAKLLYASKRCRLDTLLAISFLCTRVTCPTEEDWLKLKRLVRYLNGMKKCEIFLPAHEDSDKFLHGYSDSDLSLIHI